MKLGEFFVQLGVKADTLKLKDFANSIGDLSVKAAGSIAAIAGIEMSLASLASKAVEASIGFADFEAQTGDSAEELEKWQMTAEQMGISADSVTSAVTGLEREMAEIRLGAGNIRPFQMLGIGVQQNAFATLELIRERIRNFNRPTAVNILSQMGIDPSMIRLLTLSDEKFKALTRTTRILSREQSQAFLQAKQTLVGYEQKLRGFAFEFLGNIAWGFNKATQAIQNFKNVVPMLTVAVAALGMVFAPVLTSLTALALLIEDFFVYKSGGRSLIGMLHDKLTPEKVMEKIKKGFEKAKTTLVKPIPHGTREAPMPWNPNFWTQEHFFGVPRPNTTTVGPTTKTTNLNTTVHISSAARDLSDAGSIIEKHIERGIKAADNQINNNKEQTLKQLGVGVP